MYVLDGKQFESLDLASKASGIAKSTLEKHINGSWKSKKGIEHTLEEIVEAPIEEVVEEVTEAPVEEPAAEDKTLYVNKYDNKSLKRVVDPYPWLRKKNKTLGHSQAYSAH